MNFTINNSSLGHNSSNPDKLYKGSLIAWFSLVSAMNIFGTCNNLLLLIIIAIKEQQVRTGSGILIAHLVFVYLVMCCLCYPTINIIMFRYPFGLTSPADICNWASTLHRIVFITANWNDVCLAINRLVAVWLPRHYLRWSSETVVVCMLFFSWTAGFSQVLPIAFGNGRKFMLTNEGVCEVVNTFSPSTKLLSTLGYVGNLTPYAVSGTAAVGILLRFGIRRQQQRRRVAVGHARTQEEQRLDRQMAFSKMLTVSFICNCLSFLPNWTLAVYYDHMRATLPMLAKWLKVAEEAQYALNSLIFWAMSKSYRMELALLFARAHKHPRHQRRPNINITVTAPTTDDGTYN